MFSVIRGLVLAGCVAIATGALAEDSRLSTYSWTGFYVGANAGYAWGDTDVDFANDCNVSSGIYCVSGIRNASAVVVAADGNGTLNPDGFTGGVQLGYNLQSGSFVFGVEADFNSFENNDSRSAGRLFPGTVASTYNIGSAIDTDWLATARGRLGFTLTPAVLIYATGGVAVTNIRISQSYSDTFGTAFNTETSDNKIGWTLGGGAEMALSKNWSLKGEYLYVDFGSVTTAGIARQGVRATQPHTTSADLTAQIARIGINYKF